MGPSAKSPYDGDANGGIVAGALDAEGSGVDPPRRPEHGLSDDRPGHTRRRSVRRRPPHGEDSCSRTGSSLCLSEASPLERRDPRRPRAASAHDRPADVARQDDHQMTPPARVCRHGEIIPSGGSCARCQGEKIERARRRGTTTARGYGSAHRALRKRLASLVASGQMRCARCGGVILPGTPFDLGHADGDRTRYHGLEHAVCNRGASRMGRRIGA